MLTEISKAMTDRMIGLATELIGEYVQREAQVRSPKVGDAYTTMKLLHRRQPLGLGPNPGYLWTGTLELVLVHPQPLGIAAARRRQDDMVDAWPRALTLVEGPAHVIIETVEPKPTYTAADWTHAPVTISWMCEEPPA